MDTIESSYDDIARTATLSSGQVIRAFHKSTACKGEVCPVHKPSNHEFRGGKLRFNFQLLVFERQVEESDGRVAWVPDPDDYKLLHSDGIIVYRNSIRCHSCQEDIVSAYRHDFVTCKCGKVSLDGGNDYCRILGTRGSWTDTSLVYDNGQWKDRTND